MSDFKDVKPYTQAELDQHAIWADEFDQWWENEGQYQRAGGGQYERSFAWWAWLNREQKQQAIIDEHTEVIKLQDADLRKYEKQIESLKAQLAVYKEDMQRDAEKISELENRIHDAELQIAVQWGADEDTDSVLRDVENALRGAND